VREKILEFQTRIEHLAIENMLANPLTKGLTVGVFQRHVTHMGLVKSFDIIIFIDVIFMRYVINDITL